MDFYISSFIAFLFICWLFLKCSAAILSAFGTDWIAFKDDLLYNFKQLFLSHKE